MELELSEKLPRGRWTNEKHFHFLNTMEASFVRTMLQNNSLHRPDHQLPLDRYLPDTSDSTLDLKSRNKQLLTSSSGNKGDGNCGIWKREDICGEILALDQQEIEGKVGLIEDRGDYFIFPLKIRWSRSLRIEVVIKMNRPQGGNVGVTSMAPAS